MRLDLIGRRQPHEAEPTRVRKADAGGRVVADRAGAEMLVLAGDGRGLLELAQLHPIQGEAAGHAEVRDPGLARGQRQEQVFGATLDALDHRPFQPLGEAVWKGKAQVGTVDADARKPRARQHRLKPAPDRLDLRKLGHP